MRGGARTIPISSNAWRWIAWPLAALAAFQLTGASDREGRRAILDRYGDRFAKEVYPLLSRGQNGCKVCHSPGSARMFRVLDTPLATYSRLLEQLLGLSERSGDPELRMPKAGTLTVDEIDRIARFARDLQGALSQVGEARVSRMRTYNVYLAWPAVPGRTTAAMVEIHSSGGSQSAAAAISAKPQNSGFATLFLDQTESSLSEEGDSQWQLIHKRVFLGGPDNYVQIGSQWVDVKELTLVAYAVKFEALDTKEEIVVDDSREQPRHQALAVKSADPAGPFSSAALREELGVSPEDEELDFQVVNNSLARSAGWLENRKVRGFDSHQPRKLFTNGFSFDQRQMMRESLWSPLSTFVRKLKTTDYGNSIAADSKVSDEEKRSAILSQDINAHNAVTACAFLGPKVKTGDLDPRYESGGELKADYKEASPGFVIPSHGHFYATAVKPSGINPKGAGKNEAPYLPFVMKEQS
ncbi:MAG TPA: hypothetical protein VL285_23945 [Bryobacteraceae bacterium]|nr:hypothetical protein [Bryobacteraceae bacterium]